MKVSFIYELFQIVKNTTVVLLIQNAFIMVDNTLNLISFVSGNGT